MSTLLKFSLTLEGDFADAWLYREHLFVWDERGACFYLPLDVAERHLRERYGDEAAFAAELLLFRNDWKSGGQAQSLRRPAAIRDAFAATLKRASMLHQMTLPQALLRRTNTEPVEGDILGTSIFANHAYVATSKGLFETKVNPRYLDEQTPLVPRLEFPVVGVAANFGAVAASGFEEGLWFGPIDLDSRDESWTDNQPFRQLADFSRSAGHASRDLLNYTFDDVPEFFVAEAQNVLQNSFSKYPSWQVRDYGRSAEPLAAVAKKAVDGSIRVLGNSNYHLLIETDGALAVLDLASSGGLRVLRTKAVAQPTHPIGSELLSTHPLANGFAVETAQSVVFINDSGVTELISNESALVRTFPSSRRYKDVLLSIQESSLELSGHIRI